MMMYGGQLESGGITNELWRYNYNTKNWHTMNIMMNDETQIPSLMGHTAHYVDTASNGSCMFVFFGYHPQWIFSDFVYSLCEGETATAVISFCVDILLWFSYFFIASIFHSNSLSEIGYHGFNRVLFPLGYDGLLLFD